MRPWSRPPPDRGQRMSNASFAPSEAIHVMLLTHAKWRTFTNRPIPPTGSSEVMLALSHLERETAAANGGTTDTNPVQDLGFLYSRSLADPDGHVWEAVWMDPAAIPPGDQPG